MITVIRRSSPSRENFLRETADAILINWRLSPRPHIWRPPTDLIELEDRFIVRVEIAGANEKDLTVTLDQNLLTVQGTRSELTERRAYHQMEINFGEFSTSIEIPAPIDGQSVSAEYKQGFLWIFLPKAQTHQIHIEE